MSKGFFPKSKIFKLKSDLALERPHYTSGQHFTTRSLQRPLRAHMNSSEEFQQHFSIISKFVCFGFYMKKNVAFTLISFTVLKWDDCLSVQLPFELTVQIPVQLLLELEPNWLVQNVIELEFELSRM